MRLKLVNIFIIFCFIIPFTASMYINIITAFAGTSAPVLSLPEQSPAAGSYGNNAANGTPSQELPEPPQKEDFIGTPTMAESWQKAKTAQKTEK